MSSNIKPYRPVQPMIYAYTQPGVTYHEGWTKIGYTEQNINERLKQQSQTGRIITNLEWIDFAQFKVPPYSIFKDYLFHNYLTKIKNVERDPSPGSEWFKIDSKLAREFFEEFTTKKNSITESDYTLRSEQSKAVEVTKEFFTSGGKDFLWNAKPRFGKTLTSYDLIRKMGFEKVLIITNRPAVANSWLDDFLKFIKWRGGYEFVSTTGALENRIEPLSREDFNNLLLESDEDISMIAFESLQGLKNSIHFSPTGKDRRQLKWIKDLEWDLLIIDESHEAIDTYKTDKVLENINRKHTLRLSGTPFKILAEGTFKENQIFNWTYADEQEAKELWDEEANNPYEELPKLNLFTYQMSNMIQDEIKKGANIGNDEGVAYTFDLNEFFKTQENNNLKFEHEEVVKKFIKTLFTNEKYPFSTPELRNELKHTLWILNRVNSAKALKKLLDNKDEFPELSEYEIILAAGDGKILSEDNENIDSFSKVKNAIKNNDKTITLSVGQLTVGVTIPEWSGVLMLSNMKSPSAYMQAAFRAQNPHIYSGKDGKRYRKQNAYVFDFDPARTLTIFDEFANNLSPDIVGGLGTPEDRKEKIKRLLNFFPVIGEDNEGRMVELDATQVLSIPRKLKSEEVVRRGFISNFLFQNVANIFGATQVVADIIEKITPAQEENYKIPKNEFTGIENVHVNKNGDVLVSNETIIGQTQNLFGDKIYEELEEKLNNSISSLESVKRDEVEELALQTKDSIKEIINDELIGKAFKSKDYKSLNKREKDRIKKETEENINKEINSIRDNFIQTAEIAEYEYKHHLETAETEEQSKKADQEYLNKIEKALNSYNEKILKKSKEILKEKPKEIVEKIEKLKTEKQKRAYEDKIRAHLRGFSRTIPSFIMAYGDENLTLANFDDYTDDEVFEEVTGITEEQFRFLRDGGKIIDEETGQIEWFNGHLFDETVFNDSIQEFLKKKEELSNYFDESNEEDIFDYIPAQRTNQIFTPKWIVKDMVDKLEEENPEAFENPNHTFADLYMKSGLYIAEIVKRLYKNPKMKELIPNDKERLTHIFKNQVYGMAPSKIIQLIATNYILGFDEDLKKEVIDHFVLEDAAKAAQENRLQEVINQYFRI